MLFYVTSKEGKVDLNKEREAPKDVFPVVRLQSDIQALEFLLEGGESTRIPCRVKKIGWVAYSIGDTSGDVIGAYIHIRDNLQFRYGQWATDLSENRRIINFMELSRYFRRIV